uniref:Uncharacterized protein n=1 Tax=Tanacetum cinerariifolium TaxID=118510 RepID=A0A6L2N6H3_TANCI|nr:hypothetical protein [Tanacetum cinerariifolium]
MEMLADSSFVNGLIFSDHMIEADEILSACTSFSRCLTDACDPESNTKQKKRMNASSSKSPKILSSDLEYDITKIVNSKFEIDYIEYGKQGKVNLSTFFALTYGFGFATIASTLTHVGLFYGKEIYQRYKACTKVVLAFCFTLPISIITATTNQTPGLNIITEYAMGLIYPGKPIANVCFKTYGCMIMTQAISF